MTIVSDKVNYRKTQSMCSGRKVCKKWRDGFWMQTIIQIPPKPKYYILAIYNVPWNSYANSFCGIYIKSTN